VYINDIGSIPEFPPVVSSMRRPCGFTFNGQQTPSVAIAGTAPWLAPSQLRCLILSKLEREINVEHLPDRAQQRGS